MRVAILGGGITGLTAAYRLTRAGHSVRVLEASPRTGGAVASERSGGWLFERGPNTLQESDPAVRALVGELGLAPELQEASPGARHRYLARGGRLVALPGAPAELAASPLLSPGAKLRVACELLRRRPDPAGEASVADVIRAHFGAEVLATLGQPFVSGVYAGDAARLSARHAFPRVFGSGAPSLLRQMAEAARRRRAAGLPPAPPLVSFRGGLAALTDALAAHLPAGAVLTGAPVRRLEAGGRLRWRVAWDGGGEEFDWVAAALPAPALAALDVAGARPLSSLGAIDYPPVAAVFLGYRRADVAHPLDGFGALVPAAEALTVLGVLFSSSLFAGRAPEGHVALTALVGGALQPDLAALPDAELAARVRRDLAALVGARGEPVFLRIARWPRAIPQYAVGYGAHLEAFRACEARHPGLIFGGNVRDGVALADCLRSGATLAQRVS
jgi:oxygen-dependent protoporphyrinogen oxidase